MARYKTGNSIKDKVKTQTSVDINLRGDPPQSSSSKGKNSKGDPPKPRKRE